MSGVAVALAHANIAFSKYWGKRPYPGNYPVCPEPFAHPRRHDHADPTVTFDDVVRTGDSPRRSASNLVATGRPLERVTIAARPRPRLASGFSDACRCHFVENDFPTASGLASSASGFAALALAAVAGIRRSIGTRHA